MTDKVCAAPGCEQPVESRRSKYCSTLCASKARAKKDEDYEPIISIRQHTAQRSCLQCNRIFLSEGPWNRICNRCKNNKDRPALKDALKIHTVLIDDEGE